jgi:undecaprenyl-diphosphatase
MTILKVDGKPTKEDTLLENLDLAILYFFNHDLANPALDRFFLFIAESKLFLFALIALAIILFWRGSLRLKTAIILVIACVAIVDPVSHYVLKPLFGRIRPCHELGDIRLLAGCGGRFGFPSNHAANAFAIAGVVIYFFRKFALLLITSAVLISLSRIYLGKHYPSDVLGGAAFGVITACLVIYLLKWILKYMQSKNILRLKAEKIWEAVSWKK